MRAFLLALCLVLLGSAPALAASNPNAISVVPGFPLAPVNTPLAGYANFQWLAGVSTNGVTDNCAAITRAMTYASANPGTTFLVPAGTYAIASATCSPFAVPNNTTFQCAQNGASIFKVTGSAVLNALFTATNPSNVWFNDCTFIGNGQVGPTDSTNAGAILFNNAVGGPADGNFGCQRCTLQNFSQPFWIEVTNNSSNPMTHIRFPNTKIISQSGNNAHPAVIGYAADAISLYGEINNVGGTIVDTVIDGMDCGAYYLKKCVSMFDGTLYAYVTNFSGTSCGAQSTNDSTSSPPLNLGAGSYCILAYSHGTVLNEPSDVYLSKISCFNPNSACLYVAVAKNIFVAGMKCIGQFDTFNATLPKGCIALNQPKNAQITDPICLDSYICVESQNDADSTVHLSNVTARSNVANALGIWIAPSITTDTTSRIFIDDATIDLTDAGAVCMFLNSNDTTLAALPGYVQINGGQLNCGSYDIQAFDTHWGGGLASPNGVDINGTVLAGAVNTFAFFFPGVGGGGVVTPLTLRNMVVDGSAFANNARGVYVPGEGGITINSLLLRNKSNTGVMLSTTGTVGSMEGVQYHNVAPTSRRTSTDFGVAKPTWSADQGTFIQNLDAACSAGSVVMGWGNDNGSTTWTTRTATCP